MRWKITAAPVVVEADTEEEAMEYGISALLEGGELSVSAERLYDSSDIHRQG